MKKGILKSAIIASMITTAGLGGAGLHEASAAGYVNTGSHHLSSAEKKAIQGTPQSVQNQFPDAWGRDTFGSMKQLETTYKGLYNKVWNIQNRYSNSDTMIFAPHGGGIEVGTTEVANAVSKKGNYDFFAFNGLKKSNNRSLHVTSTHYDEPDLLKHLKTKKHSISIHGAQGNDKVVYVGGANKRLGYLCIQELNKRGIKAVRPPQNLSGTSAKNIVNRNKTNQGVQLEMTTALRKSMFKDGNTKKSFRTSPWHWSQDMDKFSDAIQTAIKRY